MFDKGNRANTLHGILLIALFSFAAFYIAEIPFVKSLSFSPLIVGIILGMLYANSLRNKLPETWVPGIKFCTKQILRTGIVLYGFRLTLTQVAAVGLPAVVLDTIIVAGTIFLGIWLGKVLKMDKDTSLMTATGSAICGAAAVLGAEPVVKCEGHKTAIAVSTVVIFGTISMFLYPILYRAGLLDALGDTGAAIYTGSTLHEVAHVAGAGNAMDPTDSLGIAGTATITKMISVMMLIVPASTLVNRLLMPLGILATIPAKMIREMPLPTPLSLICSPSHIRKAVPAVSTSTIRMIENTLLSTTASRKRPTVSPTAWIRPSTTVR